MSLARECDRCGKLYKQSKLNLQEVEYSDGRPILKITIYAHGVDKDMDLCPECAEGLRDYLGRMETCLK